MNRSMMIGWNRNQQSATAAVAAAIPHPSLLLLVPPLVPQLVLTPFICISCIACKYTYVLHCMLLLSSNTVATVQIRAFVNQALASLKSQGGASLQAGQEVKEPALHSEAEKHYKVV